MSSFSGNTKQPALNQIPSEIDYTSSDVTLGTFMLISNGKDNNSLSQQVENLQIDFSDCYEAMFKYLVGTGRFNANKGLTRTGFTLESIKYSLDQYSYHDEKWEEYYQNYLQLENQAKAIGIELMFHNHVTVDNALTHYTVSVDESNEEVELPANVTVPIGKKRKSSDSNTDNTSKKRKFTVQVEQIVLGSFIIEACSSIEAKQFSIDDLQDKHEYQFIKEYGFRLTGNVKEL